MLTPASLNIFVEYFVSTSKDENDYKFCLEDCEEFISVARGLRYEIDEPRGKALFEKVELVENPPEQRLILESLGKTASDRHYIKFSFTIYPTEELADNHFWGYACDISKRILQLSVAASITWPLGHIGPNHMVAMCNGRVVWTRFGNGMLSEYLYGGMQFCNWPTYERLNLKETWEWVQNRKGFLDGRSNNKVSRALACYTQLFTEFRSEEDYLFLLWSMIGLEALTNSGPAGLQSAFYNRICEMLGEPQKGKEEFKNLYRERSKLIHGQYDLPGFFGKHPDIDSEVMHHPDELYNAQALAIAIFVGCLQYCAKNKIADIHFTITKKETVDP